MTSSEEVPGACLSWRRHVAALALTLALTGCGDTLNNSVFDRLAEGPAVPMPARAEAVVPRAADMGGHWVLTMPGTGSCGLTFANAAAAGGSVLPESACPGRFSGSRRWDIQPDGVTIRDQSGISLAQLRMTEPGRLEGQTVSGAQVLLAR
jgi:hypothetical protein